MGIKEIRGNAFLAFIAGAAIVSGFWGCSDDPAETGAGGADTTGPGSSTVGPVSSSTSSGMPMNDIGAACTADNDCGAGLTCLNPAGDSMFLGGGAVGGYCTKDCVADSECGGAGNRCLSGQCWQGCGFQAGENSFINDPLDPMKCHGREDVRCHPDGALGADTAVCIPTCGDDSQCGGRYCNHRTGACVGSMQSGKPDGVACDDTQPDNDGCLGVCQPFTDGWAVCGSTCVLDGDINNAHECGGGLTSGVCVFKPSANAAGDWGRCTPTCDSHNDCFNPNLWCRSTTYAPSGLGYCLFATECPNGTECANLMPPALGKYECVDTGQGKYCLEVELTCGGGGAGGAGGAGGGAGGAGGGTGGAGGGTGGAGGGTGGAGGAGTGGAGPSCPTIFPFTN